LILTSGGRDASLTLNKKRVCSQQKRQRTRKKQFPKNLKGKRVAWGETGHDKFAAFRTRGSHISNQKRAIGDTKRGNRIEKNKE